MLIENYFIYLYESESGLKGCFSKTMIHCELTFKLLLNI